MEESTLGTPVSLLGRLPWAWMSDHQRVRNGRNDQNRHPGRKTYPVFRQESVLGSGMSGK